MLSICHCGTQPLTTQHLSLRPFAPTDAQDLFHNLTCDVQAAETLGWEAHTSLDQTTEMLREWHNSYKDNRFYIWAVILSASDTCIGLVQLHEIQEEKGCCELGFWIGRAYRRQGYAAEAAQAVLDFAFAKIGFPEVCALHFAGNLGAESVLRKLGMKRCGLLTSHVLTADGRVKDCVLYSLRCSVK